MNDSVTLAGILVAVAVPTLIKLGFGDDCANQIVNYVIPLIGGAIAWFGRVRAGGVGWNGLKK